MTSMEKKGIIIVDKEPGYTSHDVIARLRGILGMRRIGHGGTLDPMATGVLPIFLGKAARASEYLNNSTKEYIAQIQFGIETDTQDITGKVIGKGFAAIDTQTMKQKLADLIGPLLQMPPMYAAIKVNGKKLVDLARQGKTVERNARKIEIFETELLKANEETGTFSFRIVCSKGTYVRTICHDIGKDLGTCATLSGLRRTKTGIFDESLALTLAQIEEKVKNNSLTYIEVDRLFSQYTPLYLDDENAEKIGFGQCIKETETFQIPESKEGLWRVYHNDTFLMLAKKKEQEDGSYALAVHKNFT